jgi:hypothetical protein
MPRKTHQNTAALSDLHNTLTAIARRRFPGLAIEPRSDFAAALRDAYFAGQESALEPMQAGVLMPRAFTTRGMMRSGCGHVHATIGQAFACAAADYAAAEAEGERSDRDVMPLSGELTAAEEADLDAMHSAFAAKPA